MKTVSALVLGILVFTGAAGAQDDYPKKIVGKWEITKAGGGAQAGTVIEFIKDNKINATIKLGDTEIKATGTYKLDKDKLTLKLKADDIEFEETLTIKKLTDDAMELEDKNGGIDVLKKLKDKKDK